MWTCPRCGREFANRGQRHACGRWTVDDHLRTATPVVAELFHSLVALVEACGPVTLGPTKTRIGFKVRMTFAAVSLRRDRLDADVSSRAASRIRASSKWCRSGRDRTSTASGSRRAPSSTTRFSTGSARRTRSAGRSTSLAASPVVAAPTNARPTLGWGVFHPPPAVEATGETRARHARGVPIACRSLLTCPLRPA